MNDIFVATRRVFWAPNSPKMRLIPGSRFGAYNAPSDPLTGFKEPLRSREGEKKREGNERGYPTPQEQNPV